jgi:hypothetical protein
MWLTMIIDVLFSLHHKLLAFIVEDIMTPLAFASIDNQGETYILSKRILLDVSTVIDNVQDSDKHKIIILTAVRTTERTTESTNN